MSNEEILIPIIKLLYEKIVNNDFIHDKSGVKIVELVCEKIELNPFQPILDFKIKKTNEKYTQKELLWYLSQDRSISPYMDDVKIWNQIASDEKIVNSNYGWCVFSNENYNQYDFSLQELLKNKESRRAIMIYNRPSMTKDYCIHHMNDYICCMYNQFLIRNNELISIVSFRSNDFIYGFFNDFFWKCFIYEKLFKDLQQKYSIKVGKIIWIANSFHVYEKHFQLIKEIYENYKK